MTGPVSKSHIATWFQGIAIREVSCGFNYVMAATNDARLFAWGNNLCSQLGLGPAFKKVSEVSEPTQVVGLPSGKLLVSISCSKGDKNNHSGCVTEEGQLFKWGDPYKG